MPRFDFREERVLIWGKTYPELSRRHKETVCTGGCLEDGTPIRLYPVGLRYLDRIRQYSIYDWISVPICKSPSDPRRESYKVRAHEIEVVGHLSTGDAWAARRDVIFRDRSWHFDCIEELKAARPETRQSLGIIPVGEVEWVKLVARTEDERSSHQAALQDLSASTDLFGGEQRELAFLPFRVRMKWRCRGERCPGGHTASVLDWGLLELGRRDGAEKAKQKLEAITDLQRYDLHLYVGNLYTRQHIFCIIGMWYPPRRDQLTIDLA